MYEHEWVCRWDHVDIAERAYFPRLVNAMHQAGEALMEELGWPYGENPTEHGMMLPIVEIGAEFERPVGLGDRIAIEVEVEMGESSLRLEFTGRTAEGDVAFTGFEQHVCVPTDEDRAIPLPDDFRAAVESYRSSP